MRAGWCSWKDVRKSASMLDLQIIDASKVHARVPLRLRTDRTAGSPPLRPKGDRRMRAVRYLASSIILASASVAVAPQAMAQQEGTTPDTSLQAKVNELDQQVRILQRLRELEADSIKA